MQTGYIYRWRGWWYVQYYFMDSSSGRAVRRKSTKKLVPVNDQYRSKKDVRELAADVVAPHNGNKSSAPDSSMTFAEYAEKRYLPHIKQRLKPSTYKFYKEGFANHVKDRVGNIKMRDFTTGNAQKVLDEARGPNSQPLKQQSLLRIKTVMSAIFTHALQHDVIKHGNPVQGSKAAGLRKKPKRYAYTLEEIKHMLQVLPDTARTVAAVAAFTGLREGEIRGLCWSDYSGDELAVRRSIWRTHVGETKNEESEATVPVIPLLRDLLAEHLDKARGHAGKTNYIFSGEKKGFSLNLDNLSRRVIRPVLGSKWHGWHAFRRGLGTNLSELGVDVKVIQTILRHASAATTQEHYIVVRSERAKDAMKEFAEEVARRDKSPE